MGIDPTWRLPRFTQTIEPRFTATGGAALSFHHHDTLLVDLAGRIADGKRVGIADIVRFEPDCWPLWIELCRRKGGLAVDPAAADHQSQINVGRRWLDAIIGGGFEVDDDLYASGAVPAMVRVAMLARGVLATPADPAQVERDRPADLTEQCLRDAMSQPGAWTPCALPALGCYVTRVGS